MSSTGAGAWASVFGLLLTLVVLVLVGTLVVYFVRRMIFDTERRHNDPAEAELRRRYAEGLLDAEAFHRQRADLRAR